MSKWFRPGTFISIYLIVGMTLGVWDTNINATQAQPSNLIKKVAPSVEPFTIMWQML